MLRWQKCTSDINLDFVHFFEYHHYADYPENKFLVFGPHWAWHAAFPARWPGSPLPSSHLYTDAQVQAATSPAQAATTASSLVPLLPLLAPVVCSPHRTQDPHHCGSCSPLFHFFWDMPGWLILVQISQVKTGGHTWTRQAWLGCVVSEDWVHAQDTRCYHSIKSYHY